jgi:hypothetical protein
MSVSVVMRLPFLSIFAHNHLLKRQSRREVVSLTTINIRHHRVE